MFDWVASFVAPKEAEAPPAFCKLVHAIASVFKTFRAQESLRPAAPELREARQTIREASRESGVVSELAKAMNVYEGPKLALLQAQVQSKAALHDQAANESLEALHIKLAGGLPLGPGFRAEKHHQFRQRGQRLTHASCVLLA